jgi:hypothetical protein
MVRLPKQILPQQTIICYMNPLLQQLFQLPWKVGLSNHDALQETNMYSIGLPYTFDAVDQAIEKLNSEVPGLINSENGHISKDIRDWLQHRL